MNHFININNSLNIKTLVITSPDQSKLIDKKIKFKVFNKLDKKFKRYVLQEVKVEETLFINEVKKIDGTKYKEQSVLVKGCSNVKVPESIYIEITFSRDQDWSRKEKQFLNNLCQ